MGLSKRFKAELVAEWRAQCVGYKPLQRQAEELVGEGDGFGDAHRAFLAKATLEMQKVERVYLQQEGRIVLTAHNLSAMVGSLCESVMDKIANGELTEDNSKESMHSLQNALAVIATFLARVDALRTFALLNVLALHKILRRNCEGAMRKMLHDKLRQYPWHMQGRLAGLLSEVEDDSEQLYYCFRAVASCLENIRRTPSATVYEIDDAEGVLDVQSDEDPCLSAAELSMGHNTTNVHAVAVGAQRRPGCSSPTDTTQMTEEGWEQPSSGKQPSAATPSSAKQPSTVALASTDPHPQTQALIGAAQRPGWAESVHINCGMCASRAHNVVQVGPHRCCWQCVASQWDQDFVTVCGADHDVRLVSPARALDRFVVAFGDFMPDTLKGIDKMALAQQLSCLGNFVRTLQGTVLCGILLNPQPRIPLACYPQPPNANINITNFNIPKIRILVADDDLSQRLLLQKMLAGIAYECVVVENGAEAIEKSAQTSYDLVLMDGFMPVKDGWQASREICMREKKFNRSALIIGVTGATDEVAHKSCRDSGMRDVVTKPINKKCLLQKIQQWISEGSSVKARLKHAHAKGDLASLAMGLDC